jgi:hypothetical protein
MLDPFVLARAALSTGPLMGRRTHVVKNDPKIKARTGRARRSAPSGPIGGDLVEESSRAPSRFLARTDGG